MKNKAMKILAFSMAAMMAFSLTGCKTKVTVNSEVVYSTTDESAASSVTDESAASSVTEESAASSVTEESTTSIANPVKEVTEDEMVTETGIDLPAPEGATNVVYSIIDDGTSKIAQMDFTLDEHEMYLRACMSSETSLNSSDDDTDSEADSSSISESIEAMADSIRKGDISGLNYSWNLDKTASVQEREANLHTTTDGVGYIAWLDTVPGVLYNLCMKDGATEDNLTEYAEKVFVPVQGES